MDFEVSYIDICRGKGVHPLSQITQVLQNQSPELSLDSSTILTDSDIFCISQILEENFPFLQELYLTNQSLSSNSISVLSQGLKSNHTLKNLSISSVNFESFSHFYKIPEALTLNEALIDINLSHNSLPDSTSNSLLELLGVLPYLKSLNISYNSLESIQWGNILAVNSSLELLMIDHNNLNYSSISNIIESLSVNRSLKVLNLAQNQRSEEFLQGCAKLLATVLKSSVICSLSVDLNTDCVGLEELSETIQGFNTDLIEIPTLEELPLPDPGIQKIWAGLKANRWIYSKLQDPNSDLDVDSDFQEVLEAKLTRLREEEISPNIRIEENVEVPVIETPLFSSYSPGQKFQIEISDEGLENVEEDLIAQAYDQVREEVVEEKSLISTSLFNDSPRNFTFSESSKSGTPGLESPRMNFDKDVAINVQRYVRNCEERFFTALESAKLDFFKELQGFTNTQQELQSQVQLSRKSIQLLEATFKTHEKNCTLLNKTLENSLESLETRLSTLEKLSKSKTQELLDSKTELQTSKEYLKDLNSKLEKYELNNKLQINSLKKSMCKKQDISSVQETHTTILSEIQGLSSSFAVIDGNAEKLKQAIAALQRSEKIVLRSKEENEASLAEIQKKIAEIEEKTEPPSLATLSHGLQKDLDCKITKLELKVWDMIESDTSKEARSSSLKTLDKKVHLIDEKFSKFYENLKDLSKSVHKFDTLRLAERLEKLEKESLHQSLKRLPGFEHTEAIRQVKTEGWDSIRSTSGIKQKLSRNSPFLRPPSAGGLTNRTEEHYKEQERLDEIGSKAVKNECLVDRRVKTQPDSAEYLPGEAESIILSAIIDKANQSRAPYMRKSFSAMSLMQTAQNSYSKTGLKFKDELSPSIDLQESLKQRGINF